MAIVLYLLYRFIFNFLLPVVRTTRQVRQQFRNMQENMGQQGFEQSQPQQSARPSNNTSKPPVGDYIDFEEIK
ncbi:MAG TPA: hypothetical protein VI233_10985 [Puia sp.]